MTAASSKTATSGDQRKDGSREGLPFGAAYEHETLGRVMERADGADGAGERGKMTAGRSSLPREQASLARARRSVGGPLRSRVGAPRWRARSLPSIVRHLRWRTWFVPLRMRHL